MDSYPANLLRRLKAAYVYRVEFPEIDGYCQSYDEYTFVPWDKGDHFTEEEADYFIDAILTHAELNEFDLNIQEDGIDFETLKFYVRRFSNAVNQHFERATRYPTFKEALGQELFEEHLAMFNRLRKEGITVMV